MMFLRVITQYKKAALTSLMIAVLFMTTLTRVASAAETQDQYISRCGCSQKVLRLYERPDKQNELCEDAELSKDKLDLYASTPKIPNPISGIINVTSLLVRAIFGSIDPEKDRGEWTRQFQANQLPPKVEISFSDTNPKQGDTVQVTAENQSFINPAEDQTDKSSQEKEPPRREFRYTVWTKNDITLQGVVAGGKEVEVTSKLLDENGAQIGKTPHEVYDNKPGCRLATRTPKIDLDADGMDDTWEAENFPEIITEKDQTNPNYLSQLRTIAPTGDADQDGFVADNPKRLLRPATLHQAIVYGEPITLAPDSEGGITGDGKFTNREEFIWGTDPKNKDTDNDGVMDEADVAGLNQSSLDLPITAEFTQSDEIRATTLGYTVSRRNNIASTTKKIISNNKEPLIGQLIMNPEKPDFEHLPVLTAKILNPAGQNIFLNATWKLNDQELPEEFQGKGNMSLDLARIKDKLDPAGKNKIDVALFDETTRQITFLTQNLDLGKGALLTFAKLAVDEECKANPCGCAAETGTTATEIGPGQYVQVQAASEMFAQADAKNLNFAWTLDRMRKQQDSGFGKTTMCFQTSETPNTSHTVELSVINQLTGKLEAKNSIDIPVNGFAAELSISPEGVVQSGSRVDARVINIRNVPPAKQVTFSWSLNGVAIQGMSSNPQLSFTAGLPGSTHTVTVTMRVGTQESVTKTAKISVAANTQNESSANAPNANSTSGATTPTNSIQASLRNFFSKLHF